MTTSDDSPGDLPDCLLGQSGSLPIDDAFREAVLARTLGVIRSRRHMKRCVLAVSLLGCYLAGMASSGLWRHTVPAVSISTPQQAASAPEKPRGNVPSAPQGSAAPVERRVAETKAARMENLRRRADRRVLEDGDVKSAVLDYERVLDLASTEQRAIAPEQDSWLLMALKNARFKEMRHDHSEPN
jgi:hypothetical protein